MGKMYGVAQVDCLKKQIGLYGNIITSDCLKAITIDFNEKFSTDKSLGAIANKLRRCGAKTVSLSVPNKRSKRRMGKFICKKELKNMSARARTLFEELGKYLLCLEVENMEMKTDLRKFAKLRAAVEEVQRTR